MERSCTCSRGAEPRPAPTRPPGVSDQAALWAAASAIAAAGFLGLHGESAAIREHGLRLALALAAEAFSAAGKAYHATGHRASAQLCAAKAATTRAECGAVVTPLLPEVDLTDSLTAREREVVLLAVTQSTRKIAQMLELSPNTINNNLARAYAKLGVSGRAELRELLEPHSY